MLLEFSSYRDLIVLELFVNWAENDLRQLFSVRRPLLGLLSLWNKYLSFNFAGYDVRFRPTVIRPLEKAENLYHILKRIIIYFRFLLLLLL